jgi:hypothetical protein
MREAFAVFVALAVSLAAGSPANAAEATSRTDYAIAIAGFPVARAIFHSRRSDHDYDIEAEIASVGLTDLIAQTSAEMVSSGTLRDGEWRPERFYFRYRYGKRSRRFETEFKAGDVVSTIVEPLPALRRRKNWVPIRPEHLRAVTDPVAGLVRAANRDPCRSPIPIYDGEARIDLLLDAKRQQNFVTDGYRGQVVVCAIRYEPRSGYRRDHRDMNYVRRLKSMEIWFAKSTTMNVYAPVFLSVPTNYGTLTIKATHFEG